MIAISFCYETVYIKGLIIPQILRMQRPTLFSDVSNGNYDIQDGEINHPSSMIPDEIH